MVSVHNNERDQVIAIYTEGGELAGTLFIPARTFTPANTSRPVLVHVQAVPDSVIRGEQPIRNDNEMDGFAGVLSTVCAG